MKELMIRTNGTAAHILKMLECDTSEEEIAAQLCEKYDASGEVIAADVQRITEKIREVGLLDG